MHSSPIGSSLELTSRMLRRAALAALSAALLALGPALVLPALARQAPTPAAGGASQAVVGGPKIVIVVGAVESVTPSFRTDADAIYAEAIKYTSNVVKVYSPNATWAAVKAAAQGASIFIYLGHGYGFPSPYKTILTPSVHDGMGLNGVGGLSDSDKKYFGESYLSSEIRLAKDAIVILNHLCYSAGSSESGDPEPTIPVAKQRVDNFASGFLRTGARAVMADSSTGNVIAMIRQIFTTHQSVSSAWHNMWGVNGNDIVWTPLRNPAYTAVMDPQNPTSGFHRSIVGNLDLTTDQIVAGATPGPNAPPQLWSLDGRTDVSPNFDGDADALNLVARFSEVVAWTATIADPGGTAIRTVSGTGDAAALGWVPLVGGVPVPDGTYSWAIHATDALASVPLDASGPFTVASAPVPATAVLSFNPSTTITKAWTLAYGLTFGAPVTGLAADDFSVTGSAAGCVVNAPTGSGTTYTVTVGSCGGGRVVLSLEPGTVTDGITAGPAGLITARSVVIDRSAPTPTAPKVALHQGPTLTGSSLPAALTWSGSDSGLAGIREHQVARSVDGAAFSIIRTGLTAPYLGVSLASGHTYRFEVRAIDNAGNTSGWVAGPTLTASLVQQTSASVVYGGSWSSQSSASFSGGSARASSAAGSSATYAFSGRSIAVVLARGTANGVVAVYIDGVLAANVDTNAAATAFRWVGFSRTFSGYGSHTIKLVVAGTVGRPIVVLDALEVVR